MSDLARLSRLDRMHLKALLESSLEQMSRAATGMLSEYRERYLLHWYGEMISETSALVDELSDLSTLEKW
jgi:hypothetical protein